MQKADTLIRTKMRLPFIRQEQVVRARLQLELSRGLRGPFTLITAPAGFGKTTLVASYVADCGIPAVWLSLDKEDNREGRFLSYLIEALHTANPAIGEKAKQHMADSLQTQPEAVLTCLINDLDTTGVEMILVLDDYQFINNQVVHDAVAFLLEHCPSTLHILIATRSDPPLPLTRLRGRGQAVELRTSDLRFTKSEAAQFLNDIMGLDLDAASVSQLEERTEGWVAGLQMAALSMRDRQDVLGFIDSFSGTNRYILDYLLDEVLANQPPEIQHFLLCTSILDRLTSPLCDALLSYETVSQKGEGNETIRKKSPTENRSASVLAHLEKANLFLVPLDDERQWYRYHHLFADLLQTQLWKSLGKNDVTRLHLRAAAWFEQNGSIMEAIQHASLAADDELVERLIEQHYMEMVNRGEMAWVRSWTGQLSKEQVYRRPWLCLYEALSKSWFGQLQEATVLLNEAEKHIQDSLPSSDTRAMLGYHAFVRSRVTAMQGDTRQAIAFCIKARENIPADNLALQHDASITLGYEYFLYGNFLEATNTLNETIRTGFTARAINNPVAAYAILARIKIFQGNVNAARELLEKAAQLIQEAQGIYLGAVGLVEAGLAAVLCEWNDLDAALNRLKRGLECLPSWGKIDDTCLAYATLSRIYLAQRQLPAAVNAIAKAAKLVQTSGVFSEARYTVETAQVRIWLAQNDWISIDQWAANLEKHLSLTEQIHIKYEDELILMTYARVLVAQGKLDKAIFLLSRLEETARSCGRLGRLIEILNIKAIASQKADGKVQVESVLSESLALAETSGFTRLFLDEGQSLQDLITIWVIHANPGPLRDYATRLLRLFAAEPNSIPPVQNKTFPANILVEPLTQRELEVLHFMALGRTNQQIANQLIVSKGTVKAHSASIYRKLDVANRTEAVMRARQLNILT